MAAVMGRASAPGRNDACPCGSGRKYKRCCGAVGPVRSASPDELLGRARLHLERDDLPGAERLCLAALEADPGNLDAANLLGVIAVEAGPLDLAEEAFARVAEAAPGVAQFHMNLGVVRRRLGRLEQAEASLSRAMQLAPEQPAVRHNLALLNAARGDIDSALTILAPRGEADDDARAALALASDLRREGRGEAALRCLSAALARQPDHAGILNDAGALLLELKRFGEARELLEAAAEADPSNPTAAANLGAAQLHAGDVDAAEASFRRAASVQPERPDVHYGLGKVQVHRHDPAAALVHFDRACALAPADARARNMRALMLLALGRYPEAWPEHEWRLREGEGAALARRLRSPIWRGEDVAGKTIVLHAEQGLGDAIQFVRYAPLVAGRGARVLLECPPSLRRLFDRVGGVASVIAAGEAVPPHDLCIPLMSLPGVFGTTLENVPADTPYLAVDPAWRAGVLPVAGGDLRVGLAWAGNPDYASDSARSVPLVELERLTRIPGLVFVGLQKSVAGDDTVTAERLGIRDALAGAADFADTAAIIDQLDLVISVDTAVAHLAAALGKPVWLLNRLGGDWRWLREGEFTPWYPTVRIFRQQRRGEWGPVLARVAEALAGAVDMRAATSGG
jgi:Flp pilus assembly protein TadD